MGLNADERKLMDELNARASEPDSDEDYEIEVWDSNAGKGARIPYRTGKNWLHSVFGIGNAPDPAGGDGAPGVDAPPPGGTGPESGKGPGKGIFGRQA